MALSLQGVFASGSQDVKSSDSKTVTIMHYMGEQSKRDGLAAWISALEQKFPEYDFVVEAVAAGQYENLLKTRIASGDTPDIFFGRPRNYREIAESGAIMDLSDTEFIDRVVDIAIEEATVNGKYYGIPVDLQVKGLFYNKDIFDKYGLELPKTYDELMAVCDKFSEMGEKPFVNAYGHPFNPWNQWDSMFVPMTYKKYQDVYTGVQAGTHKWSDLDVVLKALTVYDGILKYKDAGDFGVDQNQATLNFAAGQRPMYINGGWIIGDLRAANPEGNFGYMGTPWSNNPEENVAQVGLDDVFMASSTTEVKDAVLAFFDYITSEQGAIDWMKNARLMSSIKGTDYHNIDPIITSIGEYIEAGRIAPRSSVVELSGEYKSTFYSELQYYASLEDSERDPASMVTRLDKEFAAIQ